ncbi:LysR family transcriptional regulator [Pigmentiphaga soli]|uniref:LysR family transcriptional regulator n=1 Tax=Pigmentiphaga soli TaxID=1007095 RepID=A0ABP8HHE6_9BURK
MPSTNALIDMRLSQLRQFLLVVETKSYQVAARQSYRSQPALSQAIHQLEQRLGAPLFEKGSRATLTPFGERCLPLIREAVAHMERSLASMLNMADVSGGRLALAILPSIAQEWLPWLLTEFNARHPGVEVRVLADDSVNVQRLVAEGEVDFAISSTPSPDPRLVFRPLVRDQYGLLCRIDHRHAGARSLRWERLGGERIIGSMMQRFLDDSPVGALLGRPGVYVSNLPTLVALVKNRVGVVPLPALAFPSAEQELAFVPLVGPVMKRTIGIVSVKGRSLLPSAQAMVDLLLQRLEGFDWSTQGTHRMLARMIRQVRG